MAAPGMLTRAVFVPTRRDDDLLGIVDDDHGLDFRIAYSMEELAREIEQTEILVINDGIYTAETSELLASGGRRLKWIQFSTAGVDHALTYGLPDGIPVTRASGIKAAAVAEHAIAMLLMLFRDFRSIEAARDRCAWARAELIHGMNALEDATLVVIGLGNIGREVARKAKAFDMRVIAVSRSGQIGENVDVLLPRSRLREALRLADAIVLCAASSPETREMIGVPELACMKRSAYFVNVARGDLVDEPALISALRDGRLAGAGLDVTLQEPLPPDHALWRLDNCVVSPHVAGAAGRGYKRFSNLFSENLRRFRCGEPLLQMLGTGDWAE